MFGPNSRYFTLETLKRTLPDGKEVTYVARRILPQVDRFALLYYHLVKEGERLDHVASEYLSDPEQYWRICDANRAMQPEQLTRTAGGRVRITLPEDVPGPANG